MLTPLEPNSVVSVCDLGDTEYPSRHTPPAFADTSLHLGLAVWAGEGEFGDVD